MRLALITGTIEIAMGRIAQRNHWSLQQGDVPANWANTERLKKPVGYMLQTKMNDGILQHTHGLATYVRICS